MDLASIIGVGVITFASTNIDDIFILSTFFADSHLPRRSIVIGQFAGIGALVLISALAALLALVVPKGWLSLLGIAPLLLGLHRLLLLRRNTTELKAQQIRSAADATEGKLHSHILTVATVTIANGGDNLGVYIPLFASAPQRVLVYSLIFAVMTGIWCAFGYVLVNNPLMGSMVRRYGHAALPFVLIALGIYILLGARALFS